MAYRRLGRSGLEVSPICLGAMMFGLIYGYLALEGTGLLFHSVFLLALGFCCLGAYLFLAHRYWFKAPQRGIALACGLYGAGLLALLR